MNKGVKSRTGRIARRAVALGLSAAMAFSVVYLNGENDRTSAADPDGMVDFTAFTDADYLTDKGIDFTEKKTYTLNSPSDKIAFTLPAGYGKDAEGYSYGWYEATGAPVKTSDSTYDAGTAATDLSKDHTGAVLYGIREYEAPVVDDPGTPEDETKAEVTVDVKECATINLNIAAPDELSATLDDANHEVKISGTDVYENVDTDTSLYYAETQFAFEKDVTTAKNSAGAVTGWKSKTAVLNSVNQSDDTADGKYIIYKKTELKDASSTLCYFYSAEVTRDYYFNIKKVSLAADGKTAEGTNLTLTKIKPTSDVVFTVDTDDEVNKIEAVNKADSTDKLSAADAKTLTFPGADANDKTTKEYTVTVSGGVKVSLSYDVKIEYQDAKPQVSDPVVKVNWQEREKASDGYVYINQADLQYAEAHADVTVPSDVLTDKAQLWETVSGTDQNTGVSDFALNGSSLAHIALPAGISTGKHTYKIWASSTGGMNAISTNGVKVFYDPEKPALGTTTVTGTVGGATATKTVAADGTVTKGFTASQDIVFKVEASDAESAVKEVKATVWGETYTGTLNSGKYEITIPKHDDFKDRTITFDIVATDLAGNDSDTLSVKIPFVADDIEVVSEIRDMDPELDETYNDTSDGKFMIVYTAVMDVEIKEAILTLVQDGIKTTRNLTPTDFTKVKDPANGDETYEYTYTLEVDEVLSTVLNSVQMEVWNTNNKSGKDAGQEFIRIDLKDGRVMIDNLDQQDKIDNGMWFRKLNLLFSFRDAEGTVAGKYQGGFWNDREKTIKDLKGGSVVSYELKLDQSVKDQIAEGKITESEQKKLRAKEGSFTLSIDPSSDLAGTEVSFNLTDAVGNKRAYGPIVVNLDNRAPTITDLAAKTSKKSVTEKTPEKARLLNSDPTIEFVTGDNIQVTKAEASILKPDGSSVDITSYLSAEYDLPATALSTLLGETPADGEYEVEVKAYDNVGTTNPDGNPSVASLTFEIDTVAPVATIEYDDPTVIRNGKYSKEKSVTFYFTIQDEGLAHDWDIIKDDETTLKSLLKVKDNSTVQKITDWNYNPKDGFIHGTLKVSGEGEHVISFHAEDLANLKGDAEVLRVVIDNTKPVIDTFVNGEIYSPSDTDFLNKVAEVDLSIREKNKDKNGIRIDVTKEAYIGSGVEKYSEADPHEGTWTYADDANYVIDFSVVDLAGNEATREITFTVDRTKPVNDVVIQDPENAVKFNSYKSSYNNPDSGIRYDYAQYFNHDVTVSLSVDDHFLASATARDTDANGNVIRTFEMSQDENTASYTATAEGAHNIVIVSKDMAGNESVAKSVSFVIDRINPVVSTTLNNTTFSEGDATRYLASDGLVGVSVSDANKDEADLTRTVQTTPPGGGSSTSSSKVSEGAQSFSTEAEYVVSFKAVDRAGNESTNRSVSFRVDRTAPELTVSGTTDGGTSTEAVTAVYSVHEAFYSDMQQAQVRIYRKLDGEGRNLLRTVDVRMTGPTTSMTETFEDDGSYEFEFNAQDKVGNSAHKTFSFLVDTTAPSLVLGGVKNYDKTKTDVEMETIVTEAFYTSNTVSVEGTREDIDGKKENLKLEQPNVTTGKEVKFVQRFTEDGIYDLNVKSKDKAGNESAEAVHFTIDKTPPEIGDLSKYDGVTLNKFVWDIDENNLVRDLTVCDVTIYLDGTAYDGVSELSDGSHVLRVTAIDELGNESSKEVSFLLDSIAPNIIVSGIENGQRIEEPVDIRVSLQIGDDTLDSVMLNDKAQTVSGNAASFKVEESGDYKLVVKAHDAAGNENTLDWSFTYGKKFNWLWILAAGGGVLLLAIILLIIRRKSWKQQ